MSRHRLACGCGRAPPSPHVAHCTPLAPTPILANPPGSVQARILVPMPGTGPGSRVTVPPAALIWSPVLYTSCGRVGRRDSGRRWGVCVHACVCRQTSWRGEPGFGGAGGSLRRAAARWEAHDRLHGLALAPCASACAHLRADRHLGVRVALGVAVLAIVVGLLVGGRGGAAAEPSRGAGGQQGSSHGVGQCVSEFKAAGEAAVGEGDAASELRRPPPAPPLTSSNTVLLSSGPYPATCSRPRQQDQEWQRLAGSRGRRATEQLQRCCVDTTLRVQAV